MSKRSNRLFWELAEITVKREAAERELERLKREELKARAQEAADKIFGSK